jgi:hypothetical protein
MSRHFDTLILDIGSCYSDTNLSILRKADNILFFGSGRRIADPDDFTGKKYSDKLVQISCHDTGTEAREIDDFISETYGRAGEKKNDTEIQERNR